MSDDDLIRRGDALDLRDKLADTIGARPMSSIHSALCEYRNAIAALPAAPAPDVAELVEALRLAHYGLEWARIHSNTKSVAIEQGFAAACAALAKIGGAA
jgi:hypothetical protein